MGSSIYDIDKDTMDIIENYITKNLKKLKEKGYSDEKIDYAINILTKSILDFKNKDDLEKNTIKDLDDYLQDADFLKNLEIFDEVSKGLIH